MQGNVCAARLKRRPLGTGYQVDGQPHEPLMISDGVHAWAVDPHYCDGTLRICKHCGSLYLEPEQPSGASK